MKLKMVGIDQFATTTGLTSKLTWGNLVVDAVKFGWDKVAKGAVNKATELIISGHLF